ncbi:hypothetical protein GCM10009128_00440 [Psychrosphaera haliotis]
MLEVNKILPHYAKYRLKLGSSFNNSTLCNVLEINYQLKTTKLVKISLLCKKITTFGFTLPALVR